MATEESLKKADEYLDALSTKELAAYQAWLSGDEKALDGISTKALKIMQAAAMVAEEQTPPDLVSAGEALESGFFHPWNRTGNILEKLPGVEFTDPEQHAKDEFERQRQLRLAQVEHPFLSGAGRMAGEMSLPYNWVGGGLLKQGAKGLAALAGVSGALTGAEEYFDPPHEDFPQKRDQFFEDLDPDINRGLWGFVTGFAAPYAIQGLFKGADAVVGRIFKREITETAAESMTRTEAPEELVENTLKRQPKPRVTIADVQAARQPKPRVTLEEAQASRQMNQIMDVFPDDASGWKATPDMLQAADRIMDLPPKEQGNLVRNIATARGVPEVEVRERLDFLSIVGDQLKKTNRTLNDINLKDPDQVIDFIKSSKWELGGC